ncbi:TonB-dependent receptor plug domain-containing protein [Hirschia maritima]|uniref:TonB-dependent receptor plug domain-containing protein n=1 Tax=Hirschia maritima TaxID=1121961 RepID=UPI0003756A65|nr:TonB-dependent receptor [Hirschia maritima]
MKFSFKKYLLACVVTMSGVSAYAQDADSDSSVTEEKVMDAIVVTGALGKARSVADSTVPIDVLSGEEITAVPFTDANDIIKTLVPSYSISRQPISDGGTFVRPASLRGMPNDKTLVLVNGKRRHRSPLVQIGGSGTQGPDIATIPAVALKSVEVLRDGAAALYGSDAIAGVLNFQLKDAPDGGVITTDIGKFYEGDGFQTTFAGNVGLALGENGFLNVSAEYTAADATVRAEQYCESWFCVNPDDPRFSEQRILDFGADPEAFVAAAQAMGQDIHGAEVVQPWGQPPIDAFRAFANFGYDIGDNAELYAFGNYSQSTSDGSFFYRYPGNGTIEFLRLEDGSEYSPLEIFPGGFTPRFKGDVTDYSGLAGIKGDLGGFTYDVSGRMGHSEIQYTLYNTINPSLGPDTPTLFRPGDLINEEMQFQADFTKDVDFGFSESATFAFGVSYLDESYEIKEGSPDSYAPGPFAGQDPFGFCSDESLVADRTPTTTGAAVIAAGSTLNCADTDDSVYNVVGVGSNGFPGYSPEFSDSYERDSYAAYFALEMDLTDKFALDTAIRYENYSDFDAETVWKVAGRYSVTEFLNLRGSVGTGFRAPTPGQQGTTNVSTRLPNGFPVATGLFPAGGAIAGALGAVPLAPEKSTNYTLGATFNAGDFSLTLDFYSIALEDRLNAISTQDVSADPTAGQAYLNFLALEGAGVVGAESIGGVFYFQNAFDTLTQGVDIVATYDLDWSNGHSSSFTGSVNYNTTEFDSEVNEFFNAEAQFDFENGSPEWRGVFTATHQAGPVGFLARANYYGSYENSNGGSTVSVIQEFDPEILVDLEVSFDVSDDLTIALGARNAFDEYPDAGTIGETCCGRIYRSDSVVDWQGGYYYLRGVATF